VRRAYLDGRFGQIHYRIARPEVEAGRTPLLCFHMSPHSGRVYQNFIAAMGVSRVAVAPDTPGFGESDAPAVPPRIEDYAAAMGDVIDALGFREVDLIGYHTGSETSVALALARPSQVRRVVMISAPIFTDQELAEFRAHYAHDALTEDGSHLVRKWKSHLYWAGPGKTIAMVADEFPDAIRNPSISRRPAGEARAAGAGPEPRRRPARADAAGGGPHAAWPHPAPAGLGPWFPGRAHRRGLPHRRRLPRRTRLKLHSR
jgi:pimeloyl-ACP methyl ester carboxylesterase